MPRGAVTRLAEHGLHAAERRRRHRRRRDRYPHEVEIIEDRGVAGHRAGVHTAPALHRRPVRDDARAAGPLLPEDLDDEVVVAVVLERRVEVEPPPGIGDRVARVLRGALVNLARRPAVVVGDEVGDELGLAGVAQRDLEVVEVTRREHRTGVPLPPRNRPGDEAFLSQNQVLAPHGAGISTAVERESRHVGAFADDDVLLRRRGARQQRSRQS